MGKEYAAIDDGLKRWVEAQHLFFVSTAPLATDGLVNCSPKGLDGLRILGPKQVVYADLGGSGIETVAHLKENGRIVIMFCALEGAPKIVRFYGHGRVVESHDAEFNNYALMFPAKPAIRNFIVVDVTLIRDACGYGVPHYTFQGERDALEKWQDNKSDAEMREYRQRENAHSLDGLPGLDLEGA